MTRHDELVELIQDIYGAGKEGRLPSISPQQLITLVLSAVRDGGLELPGEVERWNYIGCYDFDPWARDMFEKRGATGFIALRQEEE